MRTARVWWRMYAAEDIQCVNEIESAFAYAYEMNADSQHTTKERENATATQYTHNNL